LLNYHLKEKGKEMKNFMKTTTLLVTIGLAIPALVGAGHLVKVDQAINESAKNEAVKLTPQGQAVADLAIVGELAHYGHDAKNPMALLVAAQIVKSNPTQDIKRDKQSEGGSGNASATGKKGALITADGLLAEAKSLAADDLQMVAMIDAEMKRQGTRGSTTTGPTRHVDRINPDSTDRYKVEFQGHEEANVAIVGDGDNDLDLYVYDENGSLIGKDVGGTDRCLVTWTPKWTGEFTIKIVNLGESVYSNYILLMTDE
jgi:hypothetical protein